jgi:hypothetical protein
VTFTIATGSSPTRPKLALRSVRDDKEKQIVEEYEINTALIESLNSMERRLRSRSWTQCRPECRR